MNSRVSYLFWMEPEENEFIERLMAEKSQTKVAVLREALKALAKQEKKEIKSWKKEIK